MQGLRFKVEFAALLTLITLMLLVALSKPRGSTVCPTLIERTRVDTTSEITVGDLVFASDFEHGPFVVRVYAGNGECYSMGAVFGHTSEWRYIFKMNIGTKLINTSKNYSKLNQNEINKQTD